jgi:hypothetical protein
MTTPCEAAFLALCLAGGLGSVFGHSQFDLRLLAIRGVAHDAQEPDRHTLGHRGGTWAAADDNGEVFSSMLPARTWTGLFGFEHLSGEDRRVAGQVRMARRIAQSVPVRREVGADLAFLSRHRIHAPTLTMVPVEGSNLRGTPLWFSSRWVTTVSPTVLHARKSTGSEHGADTTEVEATC